MQVKSSITIDKASDIVFKFMVTDFTKNSPKLGPEIIGLKQIPAEEIKIGTKYEVLHWKAGYREVQFSDDESVVLKDFVPESRLGTSTLVMELIEYELNKKVTFRSLESENAGLLTYTFDSVGSSTNVKVFGNLYIAFTGENKLLAKIPQLYLAFFVKRGIRSQLKQYKVLFNRRRRKLELVPSPIE